MANALSSHDNPAVIAMLGCSHKAVAIMAAIVAVVPAMISAIIATVMATVMAVLDLGYHGIGLNIDDHGTSSLGRRTETYERGESNGDGENDVLHVLTSVRLA
jgi:predicted DNA repair protein MutK